MVAFIEMIMVGHPIPPLDKAYGGIHRDDHGGTSHTITGLRLMVAFIEMIMVGHPIPPLD